MKWIKLSERLPTQEQKVLVYNDNEDLKFYGPYFIATFWGIRWDISNDTYPNSSNYPDFIPSYWMPLPEPPRNEETKVPNEETIKALEETDRSENLIHCENFDDFQNKLK